MGSLEETKVWMMFAKDCGHITVEKFNEITEKFNNVGGKIYKLYENWKTV
jgi:four helix bundle protein